MAKRDTITSHLVVRDAARAVQLCLERGASGVFNVGSGRAISNAELAQLCVAQLGSSSPIVFSGRPDSDDGMVWQVSIAKAARELGWSPVYTIEDSLAAVADAP